MIINFEDFTLDLKMCPKKRKSSLKGCAAQVVAECVYCIWCSVADVRLDGWSGKVHSPEYGYTDTHSAECVEIQLANIYGFYTLKPGIKIFLSVTSQGYLLDCNTIYASLAPTPVSQSVDWLHFQISIASMSLNRFRASVGPREKIYFLKGMTNSFQTLIFPKVYF